MGSAGQSGSKEAEAEVVAERVWKVRWWSCTRKVRF